MELSLRGLNILILGGDKRELELFAHIKKLGASVCLFGFDKFPGLKERNHADHLQDALKIAHVIITPLTGIEADGEIYAPYSHQTINILQTLVINAMKQQAVFIAGYLHDRVKDVLQEKKIKTCETREMDEISILNAIPTAEGAIQKAMANTEITIHNSQSFVLGYGRCGKVLASTLQALGASVTVAARRYEILAWVEVNRMRALLLDELSLEIHKADIIFNTIPYPVLNADILFHVKPSALIIEIASYPGGVNRNAAERLNIQTIVLPGLPGKVAPVTAGRILCRVYPPLIISLLKGGEKNEVSESQHRDGFNWLTLHH